MVLSNMIKSIVYIRRFPPIVHTCHVQVNAINCARSIIKILDQAINPILNQYDYPEMSVRIGIDIGENVIKFHRLQQSNDQEREKYNSYC
jgi:hypothetical protein